MFSVEVRLYGMSELLHSWNGGTFDDGKEAKEYAESFFPSLKEVELIASAFRDRFTFGELTLIAGVWNESGSVLVTGWHDYIEWVESHEEHFLVDVLVYDSADEDDINKESMERWSCMYGGHPFAREFDDLIKARDYACLFDAMQACWTLRHGNGMDHEHCIVIVTKYESDVTKGTTVFSSSWAWGAYNSTWSNEECEDLAI